MYVYLCVCLSQSIRGLANSPFRTGVLLLDYCTLTESMLTPVVPTGRGCPLGVCGPSNTGGTPENCVRLFVCVCVHASARRTVCVCMCEHASARMCFYYYGCTIIIIIMCALPLFVF